MTDLKKLRNIQQKDTNYCSPQPVLTNFLQTTVEVQTPDSHINIHTCEHLKLGMSMSSLRGQSCHYAVALLESMCLTSHSLT